MVGMMKTMNLLDRCLTERPISWRIFIKTIEIQWLALILLLDRYVTEAFYRSGFRMAPIADETSGVGLLYVHGTVDVGGTL